ncbi:MAG: Ig-like domain-containing protein, partial [Paramuribaculum sp.]|nr:Ig-like domain-containing protein [Paramuribaculum sp.]
VTWTSADQTIAAVDATGKVKAIRPGSTYITATTVSRLTANRLTTSCKVTVFKHITSAEDISLNLSDAKLTEGESVLLTATISPENTSDKSVIWTSADQTVATVDENGKVTAIKPGATDITATTENGLSASCKITVTVVEAEGITLNYGHISLGEGNTVKLTATVSPENTTDKSVTWTSEDETIATVDETGKVTAIKPGSTDITATTENGITKSCKITVKDVNAKSITLNIKDAELTEGDNVKLSAIFSPENTTDKSVTWTSADQTIATVDETGKVTAIKPGEVNITATTANGLTASCRIAVQVVHSDGITLNFGNIKMAEGDNVNLTATVSPKNTTDKSVIWASADETIATVDAEGIVTAIKPGETDITATTANGMTTSCTVTVLTNIISAESISLNLNDDELTEGESVQLTATVSPENATDKSVSWVSADETIATVDAYGTVMAIKPGETDITATTVNNISASCRINVKVVEAERITLNFEETEMTAGDMVNLTATVSPKNTTDKSVTWTSEDQTIATVDENGIVTAFKPGDTVITATTANGLTASCSINVKVVEADGITLNYGKAELGVGSYLKLTATISPQNTTDQSVTWTSEDETIATVDETGKVTAIKPGTTNITATTANGIAKSCEINVIVILAYDITLNIKETEISQGESRLLTATVSPKNATDKTVIWTSEDATIATVDETGKVTAIKPGITNITASTTTRRTASCSITVKAVDAEAITLNRGNAEITEGDYVKLTPTVSPENTTDKSVTWTSADETIATVDALGKVKARKPGTTHITATTANGITALCEVTVPTPVIYADSISLNIQEEELTQGESAQLTATVSPENATDKSITWTSADETIATVDETGKVKAINRGETDIIAITANGLTASYKVTVKVIDADSITLSLNDTIMAEGDYVQLTATVSPENTTNKTITWTSADETIATVDTTGKVTAVKSGTTDITATTVNGLTASCEITVVKYFIYAESISLNLSEDELTEGDNLQLTATVSPENATYKSVTWASADETVATVDETGMVAALKPGETEITAKTSNGITAACRIYVRVV